MEVKSVRQTYLASAFQSEELRSLREPRVERETPVLRLRLGLEPLALADHNGGAILNTGSGDAGLFASVIGRDRVDLLNDLCGGEGRETAEDEEGVHHEGVVKEVMGSRSAFIRKKNQVPR